MSTLHLLREAITWWRNALITAAACDRGRANQLDRECRCETLTSAGLKFRAAWLELFAAMLGQRSDDESTPG